MRIRLRGCQRGRRYRHRVGRSQECGKLWFARHLGGTNRGYAFRRRRQFEGGESDGRGRRVEFDFDGDDGVAAAVGGKWSLTNICLLSVGVGGVTAGVGGASCED